MMEVTCFLVNTRNRALPNRDRRPGLAENLGKGPVNLPGRVCGRGIPYVLAEDLYLDRPGVTTSSENRCCQLGQLNVAGAELAPREQRVGAERQHPVGQLQTGDPAACPG